MAVKVAPPRDSTVIEVLELSQDVFSPFGTVIENPAPSLVPSAQLSELPPNSIKANQGSALKYMDVTLMRDYYDSAPSKKGAKVVMNMFVCAPRDLLPAEQEGLEGFFPVKILERHPYTSQTFIPLGLSKVDAKKARYLVIVAPSLEPSLAEEGLPVPSNADGDRPPGRGLPDLTRIKAFTATGAQAVTYGAGTWHAPMVVIGKEPIDFVVVQFANGVDIEDCQEAELSKEERGRLSVAIPRMIEKVFSKL